MWKCYPRDSEQKQVQHKQDIGEIQNLPKKNISNEHSFVQAHGHAHYQACAKYSCTQNGASLSNGLQVGGKNVFHFPHKLARLKNLYFFYWGIMGASVEESLKNSCKETRI